MSFDISVRVIVIDDMGAIVMMVKNMLTQMGFSKHTEASDGKIAWEKIEEAVEQNQPFGLIIADWNMPQMSGLELLKKVRNHPTIHNTPFIMITAENERDYVNQAIKDGVSDFIVKPFSAKVLKDKLDKLVG